MPALSGQIIMTIPDTNGAPAIYVSWFFDPVTRVLRNNPSPWTAPDGTVWATGTGALIADNQTGHAVRVAVRDGSGNELRQVRIPAGGGRFTKNQLANANPPDGPYTSADDFNGLSFDLS